MQTSTSSDSRGWSRGSIESSSSADLVRSVFENARLCAAIKAGRAGLLWATRRRAGKKLKGHLTAECLGMRWHEEKARLWCKRGRVACFSAIVAVAKDC